jgi:hypothetical protein
MIHNLQTFNVPIYNKILKKLHIGLFTKHFIGIGVSMFRLVVCEKL